MQVTTHDGLSLDVFATELRHPTTIVFVNALGIGSTITEALAEAVFLRGYNFVTWDGRGFPGAYDDQFRRYETADQVRDLGAVVEQLGLGPVVLSAWCTGVQTAVVYAAEAPVPVQALVLFNSPNHLDDRYSGVTGDAIGRVSELLVADERKLDFLYSNIFASSTEASETRMTALSDPRMQALVQAPFRSGKDALLRYAHLIKNTSTVRLTPEWCERITHPTLIVGGGADTMVSYRDSISLGEMVPGSVVRIVDGWNHYDLFSDVEFVADRVFADWVTHRRIHF